MLARFDNQGQLKAHMLTREHKALFPSERQRIEKAGGFVSKDGRLQGKTEVSRAFGDAALKSKGLSAVADVQIFNLTKHDKFLLLGCDGFWSCWSADDAVTTTQGLLEAGRTPKEAANRIVYLTIRERRCKDNCSVLIMTFEPNQTTTNKQ